MRRKMMFGKIHRAVVTDCNVDYVGSITLDPHLMEAAEILPNEQVHVLDVDNGQRFVTYAIEGTPGGGEVVVNGAAAHLVDPGHRVIVIAYVEMEDEEARVHTPRVVRVDEANRPVAPVTA